MNSKELLINKLETGFNNFQFVPSVVNFLVAYGLANLRPLGKEDIRRIWRYRCNLKNLGPTGAAKRFTDVIFNSDFEGPGLIDVFLVVYNVHFKRFKEEPSPRVLNLGLHLLSHLETSSDRDLIDRINFAQKIGTFTDILMYAPYTEEEVQMIFDILQARAIAFMDYDFAVDKFEQTNDSQSTTTLDYNSQLNCTRITQLHLYVFVSIFVLDKIIIYTEDQDLKENIKTLRREIEDRYASILSSLNVESRELISALNVEPTHRVLSGNLQERPDFSQHYTSEQIANIKDGIKAMAEAYPQWEPILIFLKVDESGRSSFTQEDLRSAIEAWFKNIDLASSPNPNTPKLG